jgi:hypothetical protein
VKEKNMQRLKASKKGQRMDSPYSFDRLLRRK